MKRKNKDKALSLWLDEDKLAVINQFDWQLTNDGEAASPLASLVYSLGLANDADAGHSVVDAG